MTIKKPMKPAKPATTAEGTAAAPATGGATIADRLKLAPTEPKSKTGTVSKKAALYALIAGLLGLAASGVLTYILYQHWQFLMPA